jgi:hypothetical protein
MISTVTESAEIHMQGEVFSPFRSLAPVLTGFLPPFR